jgi:hypothetical protein
MNAYTSLHQEYSCQCEIAPFRNNSNDVQWYTLHEEKQGRRNLKSHQISILYLGYSDDKSANTRFYIRLAWSLNALFIIRSHEPLKITQSFHIGSFWPIELPLRLGPTDVLHFSCSMALQNIQHISAVFSEVSKFQQHSRAMCVPSQHRQFFSSLVQWCAEFLYLCPHSFNILLRWSHPFLQIWITFGFPVN